MEAPSAATWFNQAAEIIDVLTLNGSNVIHAETIDREISIEGAQ